MPLLSMNELTTYRWSFEEDVSHYAAAGIAGIGVWRQKFTDFGEDRAVELLEESGLKVSSLLWAGGFTGSDGRSYKESVEDAKEAFRQAAAMKAACLICYSGPRAGHTHNHARRLMKNAIKEVLPLAEEFGIPLAIEPMHEGCAGDWTFLTCLDDTLEMIAGCDSPYVKLAFDSYHLCQNGSVAGKLPGLVDRIAIVQLGDANAPPSGEPNRVPLGEGKLPLAELVSALQSAGYDGYYDVELMGEDVESRDYGELIEQSKTAFNTLATTPSS